MRISPSIMCADLLDIRAALRSIEEGGADTIHVDIMDGRSVPGFTFGADFVKQLGAATAIPLDLHLMSEVPEQHVDQFLELGIDSLAIHAEARCDVARTLGRIRAAGVKSGIALNPGTPLSVLEELYHLADIVLVMSVSPGFIGQPQSRQCLEKAGRLARSLAREGRTDIEIVLDGGVKPVNAAEIAAEGVHRVVSGTGVFRPDMSPRAALDLFRTNLSVIAA